MDEQSSQRLTQQLLKAVLGGLLFAKKSFKWCIVEPKLSQVDECLSTLSYVV